jgi:nitrate/TMAO reductase-like tetraheme cytochrome c subunit
MHTLDLISILIVGAITIAWLIYRWKKPANKKSGLCGTCHNSEQCSIKSFVTQAKKNKKHPITFKSRCTDKK